MHIWLRCETKNNEYRTPITPVVAGKLIADGYKITVEKSVTRCFSDQSYLDIGCILVDAGSWIDAPLDAFIIGLKELPNHVEIIKHRHIYFAHCYKNQNGWYQIIQKFKKGNGQLFDLEYLTDDTGQRLVAFGVSAGIAGTLLAVQTWCSQKELGSNANLGPIKPATSQTKIVHSLKKRLNQLSVPKVIVIGASGRCGTGSVSVLNQLGIIPTKIGRSDNDNNSLIQSQLLEHDIVINCINLTSEIKPFITKDMLTNPLRKITVIVDISCDYSNPFNPIAIYHNSNTFDNPINNIIIDNKHPLDLIAIDNLPSMLPIESSNDFAIKLYPYLLELNNLTNKSVWRKTLDIYLEKYNAI